MRRAFADTLLDLARSDERVIFLTGDLGFQVFDAYCDEFPRRYLNVGVAEAHLVDCAAGMALEGMRPVVYSIASFMTGRAFEQIRLAVGYHGLPVIVVGAGGGFVYSGSGVTHHAREDLALMSLIPGMTVVAPGDPSEVAELLPALARLDGPSYIRVGRFGEPALDSDAPIVLGQARRLRPVGESRLVLCTTGDTAVPAQHAARQLALEGIDCAHYHFHTVRPLDEAALAELAGQVDTLMVIEDHGPEGGLGASIAMWIARTGTGVALRRLGPGAELVLGNPHPAELRAELGYDAAGIVAACRAIRPH